MEYLAKDIKDVVKIKPGIGINRIRFGIKQRQLRKLVGQPSSYEKENDIKLSFKFDNLDIDFSFDQEDEFRLTSIDIYPASQKIILFDTDISKFNVKQIADFFMKHNFKPDISKLLDEISQEEKASLEDEILYSFDPLGLTFFFENDGKLNQINVAVLFKPGSDEEIMWPK